MARDYMSVREVAQQAGVSVQAVYKWIAKGELEAEVVKISKFEKRYHVRRRAAEHFLRLQPHSQSKAGPPAPPGRRSRSGAGNAKLPLTPQALLESGLIGLWKDRDDIGDSVEYARKLRKQASTRHRD